MIVSKKMVPYNPKLLDDSGEVPKLNGVVGGLIPDCEFISLLDIKTSEVVKCNMFSQNKNKNKIDR